MPNGKVRTQRGVTYVALLILIAILGMVAASAGRVWSALRQQEREQELLRIGEQFRSAIGQYYQRTPGTVKRYPATLSALLADDRFMSTQRPLRKLYTDPMTRRQEWGLVRAEDGGIAGVYSLSDAVPRKTGGPDPHGIGFEQAHSYRDWRFVYRPASAPPAADGP